MFLIGKEGVIATFKHPALNSIILELVYQLFNRSSIAPYLLNQIFFFLTALAIWRVGREFFTPFEALAGALMFYCYWAYFYSSLNFNHNIMQTTAWSFVILYALLAIKFDRYQDWIGLGVAIGIGVHCKITIIFLVFAILFFTFLNSSTRKYWLRGGVYLAIFIALTIASPIIYWIFISDFSFLKFPLSDSLTPTLTNRFFVLFDAIITIPLLCLSFVVLSLPLTGIKIKLKEKIASESAPASASESEIASKSVFAIDRNFARNFLLSTALISWILMAFSCFVSAANRDLYDFTQNFIFTGLILIGFFQITLNRQTIRNFFIFFAITMAGYVFGYFLHIYAAYHFRNETWYLFPGKQLAEKVENIWHSRYQKPLQYITGDWLFAGNVAIYSKDRPTCHCTYVDFPLSTWSTDQDFMNAGGIAIWDIEDDSSMRKEIQQQFQSVEIIEQINLQTLTINGKKQYQFIIAIIPPDNSIKPKSIKPAPLRLWTIKR
jgi:4-amino-4-deoxy-L-arabinose transferase-like glycosyltransferase